MFHILNNFKQFRLVFDSNVSILSGYSSLIGPFEICAIH